jgi:hypothetical protein
MGLLILPPSWTCAVGLLPGLPGQPALPYFQCPGPGCIESAGGAAAEPHRERRLPGFAVATTQPCKDVNTIGAFQLMMS